MSLRRLLAMGLVVGMGTAGEARAQEKSAPALVLPSRSWVAVQASSDNSMNLTVLGGLATGEGGIDLGIALGAALEWALGSAPVRLRVDPYFARHGGSCEPASCNLTLLGVGGSAVYHFPGSQRRAALQGPTTSGPSWYAFAGLGIYRSQFDASYQEFGASGNSTDLGLQLGGGAKVGSNLAFEARYMDVDGFNPLVLMVGWKLK